jgi:hypothetical protein
MRRLPPRRSTHAGTSNNTIAPAPVPSAIVRSDSYRHRHAMISGWGRATGENAVSSRASR